MNRELNFTQALQKLEAAKYDLPVKLAHIAQNYFANAFRKGMFDGKSWPEVQRRIPGTNAYKYPKGRKLARHSRGILIGETRDLYHSIQHSIRDVNWTQIVLGTDVPYAVYQNEGTEHIPQRQFIGDSEELNHMVQGAIEKALDTIFE